MPASQTITRLSFAFLITTLRGIPFVSVAAASPKPQKPCRTTPLLTFTVFITLFVTAIAPALAAVSSSARSLFTSQIGTQTAGTLVSFDGTLYTVSTSGASRHFRAAGTKSIQVLVSTPTVTPQK